MKRKVFLVVLAVILLAATASIGFAATNNGDYFDWMFDAHKQWVKQAVENKQLTPEQGEAWNSHFDWMQKFHRENGFICPGPGMMGGFGPGMMGWNPDKN